MANRNEVPQNTGAVDPMVLMAASGGMAPEIQTALAEYLKMQTDRLRKVQDAEDFAAKQVVETAKNFALQSEAARKQRVAEQSNCRHLTADGRRSQLAGQRLPGGKRTIRCQTCMKKFDEKEPIPSHLQISAEKIGGPSY